MYGAPQYTWIEWNENHQTIVSNNTRGRRSRRVRRMLRAARRGDLPLAWRLFVHGRIPWEAR
jgi:hypothetical protein